jgi:DNA repair exonuclease SbcCD ATPase subunit
MKLTLTHFRCYRSTHVFSIEDSGITLISGPSGTGKTTLLMAIYFVLTGNCPSKVISDGADSCTVQLEHNQETFTRTRRPNRLVVQTTDGVFEDDVAQSYIHRKWGRHFDITSYIQQQYQKTFLFQSPSEKLEILEKLCFDENPDELKKKCSNYAKILQNRYLLLKGKSDTLSKMVSHPIDIPSLVHPPDTSIHKTLIQKLQELKKEESQYYEGIALESKIQEVERQLLEFTHKLEQITVPSYSKKVLEDNLIRLRQINELPPLENVWQRLTKEEAQTQILTVNQHIQLHKEHQELVEKVEDLGLLEGQLRSLTVGKNYFLSLYEGEYECPQCKSLVSLINEQLVLSEHIGDEQRTYMNAEQKKMMLNELDQQIVAHEREIAERLPCRARKEEIENIIDFDLTLEDLEKEYVWAEKYYNKNLTLEFQNDAQEERKKRLLEQLIPEWTLPQTLDAIDTYKAQESIRKQVEYFTHHLLTLENKRAHSSHYRDSREKVDIDTLKNHIQDTEQRIHTFNSSKHAYEIYTLQRQQYEKYLTQLDELKAIQVQMKTLERQMTAATELKKLILKTESEVIDRKILEISQLVNTYLESIFLEPITVQLHTLKKTQTQNEKVQVQLEVYYKNMKCDVSILSGGEQARMNLAFILAFAHVFHAPLLLLDECTSNLDAELTETVIEQIEHVGIPKVIMIAHQIVEGNFKQILQVA